MNYQKVLPPSDLLAYVQYFWIFEDYTNNTDTHYFKIIPDGIPALIFYDTPNLFIDEKHGMLPQLYLYGAATTYSNQQIQGNFRVIGVYFQPTAVKALFSIDAIELSNLNLSIEDLIGPALLEQLLNASSTLEKLTIISNFLTSRIQCQKYDHSKASLAYHLLQKQKSLSEVQTELRLSERSLERIFQQHIGISPKTFSRILRFQDSLSSLKQLTHSKQSLTTVGYTHGYFDQSHFIREFQEFTGSSPKKYLSQSDEHLPNFPEWKK